MEISAMLMTQPGKNRVKKVGNHMSNPEVPMMATPQNTAK